MRQQVGRRSEAQPRSRAWAWFSLASCWLVAASAAFAEVKEPNGVAVPLNSNNGETQLSTLFTQQNEMLDFIVDGSPTPDTFSPLCGFKATLMLKESGSSLGVGWYNADPARMTPPASSELYLIVPAGSAVGTSVTGADIRKNPSYAGGAIGFALIKPTPSYSEARYNTICNNTLFCPTPAPWILSVSYKSMRSSSSYYVAFEDGATTSSGWSNDGDFNDYVFLFEGLSCVGEGASCDVQGAKGVCVPGVLTCSAGGDLTCTPVTAKSAEKCDGVDNDCNGVVDDGDALCGATKVCSRGQCVPRCGSGEFRCSIAPFTQCEKGLCVDPLCAGKTCAAGQACIAGKCRAPCDGVSCPAPLTCRSGSCVDPCAGVTCDAEHVCSGGGCILRCDCAGCDTGLACGTDGLCVELACASKTCAAGSVCKQGQCEDACLGASCPAGTRCEKAACVVSSDIDAGTSMSMPGDAGALRSDAGDMLGADAALAADGGKHAGATSGSGHRRAASATGCGCAVAHGDRSARARYVGLLLSLLAITAVRARHRRRAQH